MSRAAQMLTGGGCSSLQDERAAAATCQLILAISLTPHGTLRPPPLKLSQLT